MEISRNFLVPLAFVTIAGINGCDKNPDCVAAFCKHVSDVTYMKVINAFGGVENSTTVEDAQSKSRSARSRCLIDHDIDPEF